MKNRTVLVVDDERGFLQITQIILQRAGYDPITAQDAAAASAIIRRSKPDAIILDDNMPGMPGSELCRSLKANPETRSIAIVMFSANPTFQDSDYLAQIGADGLIQKPCMPQDILSALESALSSSQQAATV
jgi:DNA-binding response OmpR family regulator